ncbi:insecticidal delta-endotoxin Cry8Ea1 family protein [Bacillus thuringiensis]|uniref:insecticidal delta-endotoxin Cry8Ea1 family protein n=1 Tax=Bacillus thuringiensis TaxID=1428 RepID=UPI0011A0452B|nr:insecticidal delta-endotoxin Cry8Ea1 family protein [Bacillus thuringiensis]
MKYKDRKNAKRKYKQTLLTTVAVMTLGVNTLGSTISVFADEKSTGVQQQQVPTTSTTDEPVFKRESNGAITVLKDKLFNIETLKAIGSLGGATLKQAWADSKVEGGNFNNTFRTLTMGSAALIPYGGVVISPLIGLLWPEDTTDAKNRLENLMKDISKQTHGQIESYDLETLGQKLDKLYKDLKEFEEIMNPNGRQLAKAPSVGDKAAAIRSKAEFIHNDFKELISESQKPSYKEAELPIFMVAATAHLNFLHYMELHGKDPKINYNDAGLKLAFLNPQKQARKDYLDYATGFAKKDVDIADQFAHKGIPDFLDKIHNSDRLGAPLVRYAMEGFIWTISDKLENTLNNSINNIAFKQILGIQSEWTMDKNGRTLYYDLKGQMQTGWKEISTSFATKYERGDSSYPLSHESLKKLLPYSWYYFSPEKTDKFEKGEMYRGTTQTINGKTYKFNKDGKCLNPNGEAIMLDDGIYQIAFSDAQSMVVDAYDSGSENLQLKRSADSAHQQWIFNYIPEQQAYQISNKERPDQVLAGNTSKGRTHNVLITKNEHKTEHYWKLEPTTDGYFKLINKQTRLGLAVRSANTHDGAEIIGSDYTGNNEQKFKLIKLK